MKGKNELQRALVIVAASLGIDFVSGRALAAFYAQTGNAGWSGIGLAAVIYGLVTGMIVHYARRCGAQGMGSLFDRLPGGGMGKGARFLYMFILVLAAGMLVKSAGDMGALALPVHRAKLFGGGLAVLAAGAIAFAGEKPLYAASCSLIVMMLAFEIVLILFAELLEAPQYEVELRLKGSWAAALGLALLHTAACLCLSVGLAVKLSEGRIRAGRMGAWAGGIYGFMLAAGNAVLMARDERILALKLPFVALSAHWGKAGFYLNAGLNWLFSVFCLAGLIYGLFPAAHRRICTENDVKL